MKAILGIKKGMTRVFKDDKMVPVTIVDTSSGKVRRNYWQYMNSRWNALSALFKRNGIDQIVLKTGESYDDKLVRFFKKRMKQFR